MLGLVLTLKPPYPKTEAVSLNKQEVRKTESKQDAPVAQPQPVKEVAVEPQPEPTPPVETPTTPQPTPVITGDKTDWMRAANIPESEWGAVDYIISHESSWNPNATNASSGAHGLPQALPYSKTGCGWVDAVCQLQWATNYANQRYGGWWGAYNFWQANHWW